MRKKHSAWLLALATILFATRSVAHPMSKAEVFEGLRSSSAAFFSRTVEVHYVTTETKWYDVTAFIGDRTGSVGQGGSLYGSTKKVPLDEATPTITTATVVLICALPDWTYVTGITRTKTQEMRKISLWDGSRRTTSVTFFENGEELSSDTTFSTDNEKQFASPLVTPYCWNSVAEWEVHALVTSETETFHGRIVNLECPHTINGATFNSILEVVPDKSFVLVERSDFNSEGILNYHCINSDVREVTGAIWFPMKSRLEYFDRSGKLERSLEFDVRTIRYVEEFSLSHYSVPLLPGRVEDRKLNRVYKLEE